MVKKVVALLQAIAVRLCLCLHFVLVVWRVTVSWGNHFWPLAAAIAPFVLESIYTLVRRRGIEWKWFSPCFFFYMAATLPGIWLLEIHRTNTFQAANSTHLESLAISGLEIPLRLSADTWVLVVEELMLYLMILGRWVLPRGEVGREQLSQLLFAFIGISSDIMELFSLFDEDMIRHNTEVTYALLGVWSWSIVQFSLTFHAAHKPRRARGLRLAPPEKDPHLEIRHAVIRVELMASILSLFMQDGPFLVLRLYCMVTYNLITYSLVFFTAKNVLVILLLLYKITILLFKRFCPKQDDDDDDKLEKTGVEDEWENAEKERVWEREKRRRQNSGASQRSLVMTDLQMTIEGPAKEAKKKGGIGCGVVANHVREKSLDGGNDSKDKDTELKKKAGDLDNEDKKEDESAKIKDLDNGRVVSFSADDDIFYRDTDAEDEMMAMDANYKEKTSEDQSGTNNDWSENSSAKSNVSKTTEIVSLEDPEEDKQLSDKSSGDSEVGFGLSETAHMTKPTNQIEGDNLRPDRAPGTLLFDNDADSALLVQRARDNQPPVKLVMGFMNPGYDVGSTKNTSLSMALPDRPNHAPENHKVSPPESKRPDQGQDGGSNSVKPLTPSPPSNPSNTATSPPNTAPFVSWIDVKM